jgi:hypothetical protein
MPLIAALNGADNDAVAVTLQFFDSELAAIPTKRDVLRAVCAHCIAQSKTKVAVSNSYCVESNVHLRA